MRVSQADKQWAIRLAVVKFFTWLPKAIKRRRERRRARKAERVKP